MDKSRQKELRLAYKLAFPPMGIYAVRHLASGRMLVAASLNVTGSLNRHRHELRLNGHRQRALMADWRAFGEAGFAFEVLEQLKERSEPDHDYAAELAQALARWQVRVPPGSPGSYT